MRKLIVVLLSLLLFIPTALAGGKHKGNTSLRDLQPAGTTDKNKKYQQYDFMFDASGNSYTCRTDPEKAMKATDYVVGSDLRFEIDGDKAKLKNAAGKEVKCTVVRVEKLPVYQR